ncbi:MAG TPA: hypothetical protein VJS20_00720 [Gemmatimonadales bacterium]|nr:hypothetical protein [Gemmatimonadales bacterium]
MIDDIRDEDLHDEELVAAARQLGVQAAGRLDIERTARGVVARWRNERRHRLTPFWKSPAMLRVAAALVLLFAGIETYEHRHHLVQQVATVEATDAGLEGLSEDQLQSILPTVEQTPEVETTAYDAGLEGLTPDELRSVLGAMGS